MKTLIRTLTICITANLIIAGFVRAQDATKEQAAKTREEAIAAAELAVKETQQQANEEKKNAEVLARQLKDLQKLQDFDFTVPTPAPFGISTSGSFIGMNSAGSVLVIPDTQINIEDVVGIDEDMNVMSRIFEQNLGKENLYSSQHWPFTGLPGHYGGVFMNSGGSQNMYLQGYGAVFMLKVDFPLSPLPSAQKEDEEKQQADENVDQVWVQTKQQIYEPQNIRTKSKQKRPEVEYDAEKVENLKTTIIESLKHASNIRALKPDESVIVVVTGYNESIGSSMTTVMVKGDKTKTQTFTTNASPDSKQPVTAKLVIRTKKSDIDEFAGGGINLEQLRGRVQIISCPFVGNYTENSLVLPTSRSSGYGEPF